MNSTQPANFPVLKEMILLEDSADHDIMGGVKTVLQKIRGGWKSDYNDISTKHKSVLKKLTEPEQKKIISFGIRSVDKLIDDVTKPIDVEPLLAVLYSKKEIEAAYLMFSSLSAGASEINKQFLLDAVVEGLITNAEAQEKIQNVAAGKFENIGPNTVMKLKNERSYLTTVLKINPADGLFDPNKAAQVLDQGVVTAKKNKASPELIKQAISTTYYMLLMLRRQLADAAVKLEKGGSTRKPPKAPAPVGGPTSPTAGGV